MLPRGKELGGRWGSAWGHWSVGRGRKSVLGDFYPGKGRVLKESSLPKNFVRFGKKGKDVRGGGKEEEGGVRRHRGKKGPLRRRLWRVSLVVEGVLRRAARGRYTANLSFTQYQF